MSSKLKVVSGRSSAWGVVLLCGWLPLSGMAQVLNSPAIDPGAIQRQERELLEQREREERLRERAVVPRVGVPADKSLTPPSEDKNILVKRFEVEPSEILSREEIDKILSPMLGQKVSLADLQRAVAAINMLYEAKRELSARAFLPTQTVKDGVVVIRLIEAKVGKISIQGLDVLKRSYVTDRLSLSTGTRLSIPGLEAEMLRFNRLNDSQLRANVQPGEKFGSTDVLIDVVEARPWSGSLFADNAGRDTVGSERVGFNVKRSNLTGNSDFAQLTGLASEGSQNYSLAYSRPVTTRDLRLETSYTFGKIQVIDGDFVPLDINGYSTDFTVGLSKPFMVDAQDLWLVYGKMSWRKSISKFGTFTQQNQDLRVVTMGVLGERRNDASSWSLDQYLSVGVTGLGGEEDFIYYRANATRFDRLNENFQLVLRSGAQLTDTRYIPAGEQFQIGGSGTVRGFSEGLLSGRNGYFLSTEIRVGEGTLASLSRTPGDPVVQGFVFIDHGGAFPYRPGTQKEIGRDDFLTSAGIGMLFDWQDFSGRITLGRPLIANVAEPNSFKTRVHAYVSYQF